MNNISKVDVSVIQDAGFTGLYGGLTKKELFLIRGAVLSQNILGQMDFTERAANYFRITQTEEKIKREQLKSEEELKQAYFEVGAKIRQTIKEFGTPMPEDLPIIV